MIKLSDYVIDFIASLDVKHVFMVPGGGCMHLVDSLGKSKELMYICNLNEQASSIAAEGYAEYTNNIGVALVTTGPGATNAITGVAAAWTDSIPLLMISGQAKTSDLINDTGVRQMGLQEIDIISMIKPITKYSISVREANKIKFYLEKAVYEARNGRKGPVWIEIPLDIQATMIDEENLIGFDCLEKVQTFNYGNKIHEIIRLLNESKRPCILAGNGIRLSGANKEFEDLIRLLNIPVLTTWKAKDLMGEEDPLFFGKPGLVAKRGANFINQNCDFMLILGSRLGSLQVAYNHQNFAKHAKKVMVDIDVNEINKMETNIEIKIVSDIKCFINEVLINKACIINTKREDWMSYCKKMKTNYPILLQEFINQKEYVNTYAFINKLSQHLNENDNIVPGSSGHCLDLVHVGLEIKKGQRIISNIGLGAMGFGIPSSIAICLASNKNRTICINGDGGLQMNIQELQTIKRLNLPIKIFILNNQGFGSIKSSQKNNFNNYVACNGDSGLTFPDLKKISYAYDIKYCSMVNNDQVEEAINKALFDKEPFICEIMTDPEQEMAPRAITIKNNKGEIESVSMEDLYPFLSRSEFSENMIANNDYE